MAIEYTDEQEHYTLTITADSVTSTDESFSKDNLDSVESYKPKDVYFKKVSGDVTRYSPKENEKGTSSRTMPRLALQLFGSQIANLPETDREQFPIYKLNQNEETICGIFTSRKVFKEKSKRNDRVEYKDDNGQQFFVPYKRGFPTILLVQECLTRFGKTGDQFVLVYEKVEKREVKAKMKAKAEPQDEVGQSLTKYRNPFSSKLVESKNLILRGAPGTGKTSSPMHSPSTGCASYTTSGNFLLYCPLHLTTP